MLRHHAVNRARFKGNVSVRSRETDSGSQRHDSIKCVSLRRNKKKLMQINLFSFSRGIDGKPLSEKELDVNHKQYTFIRRFYPKRLTITFRLYIFISMCVPWDSNPQPFALLTQCSTTEPHRNIYLAIYFFIKQNKINKIHASILLTALWSQRN